ncbi:heme-binding domain-containing protein [Cellulophaga sp. HaHaR_3_176]|uniref:heme-binding domain-containing protein n=1 Tax=Cellulophaga sp. HaHaR_3_176 TaxID=1942464 RepID=UPI001C1F63D9|nr:heme-binding domain-containing protein [Cellulophaga sp. HaHaR_3_176]QWX82607.1 heme-binding domain-containing protein [Cellulophaga sp. HaHaR_3_176]
MKIIKNTGLALILIFALLQFYRPEKNMSESNDLYVFTTETNPPKNVKISLENACYDCHSNTTHYPWYANLAPVSYWVNDHVQDGKKHLNFSEWGTYTSDKKSHKLEELVEEVDENKMPLNEYIWLHSKADLSTSEKNAILEWANKTRLLYQLKMKRD